MDLDVSAKSLPVFAALDSNVRLTIIQLLSKRKMNVTELAFALNLSNAITTKHLDKLEAANIIKTEKKGKQRVSSLTVDTINIGFPKKVYTKLNHWHLELPIGQYTNFQVAPTCGLAGQHGFIGKVDNPQLFHESSALSSRNALVCTRIYRIPNAQLFKSKQKTIYD